MQINRETLLAAWRRLRPPRPHTKFIERLRHIVEEAALTIIVLLLIAGIHWVAEASEVEQRTLLRHLRVADFLDLAHAANMARLVLFSFGVRV
jgi:hypothetical protein